MKYKIPPIHVDATSPLANDPLDTRPAIDSLTPLIDRLEAPYVLAINSPWGTGKTTLLKRLQLTLNDQGYKSLYFDAWATDFAEDPLVAFIGEIMVSEVISTSRKRAVKDLLPKVARIASALSKQAITSAGKIITHGLVDLDSLANEINAEDSDSVLLNAVDIYKTQKELMAEFRDLLKKVVDALLAKGEKKKIIIFVDELDRCQPLYAIRLLERMKHFFDIDNILFVLAIDKEQLGVSLGAVYGANINVTEYMRRFIDLEYLLPKPEGKEFTKYLIKQFGFMKFFGDRPHPEFSHDYENLVETFTGLSDVFNLSLRAREQCFNRMSIIDITTQTDRYIYPTALAMMVTLRESSFALYRDYIMGDGTAQSVLDYIKGFEGGPAFLQSHVGAVVESFLIVLKNEEDASNTEMDVHQMNIDNSSIGEKEKVRSAKILDIVREMSNYGRKPNFKYFVKKIELASQYVIS